ncbi:hypothetical protein RDV89_05660 [Nocardioides zeae]|uniref:Capsular polysaccharide biosynthesis protein n=1 Tax=Nocardioides imazamoxiresistens TaxID=3231893 RepID=A0ABU3PTN4_9ACTN|nr:hypothetical protein [Nocardioides zeae]MDT9592544.1 hypothetical protein [Nocardioides zeae]
MDLTTVLRMLARRWYVAVVAVALAGVATLTAAGSVPTTTTAGASVLLLPPASSLGEDGNPYLYLGGLGQAADVLVARLDSEDVAGPVRERHPDVEIVVTRDTTTTGPILLVTATATDASTVGPAVEDVLATVPDQLRSLQDSLGVPEGSVITSTTLTDVDLAPADTSARTRAGLAAGAVGLGAAVLLTCGVDLLLMRRRRGAAASDREDHGGGESAGTTGRDLAAAR